MATNSPGLRPSIFYQIKIVFDGGIGLWIWPVQTTERLRASIPELIVVLGFVFAIVLVTQSVVLFGVVAALVFVGYALVWYGVFADADDPESELGGPLETLQTWYARGEVDEAGFERRSTTFWTRT